MIPLTHPTVPVEQPVVIGSAAARLRGSLVVPPAPRGLVLFAHGSGSSRLSPRNRFVASRLHARGLATLLLDLLEPREEGDRRKVFDIPLLAGRLGAATAWAEAHAGLRGLPLGYFGASTGAAVALREAARPGARIAAVVSRGGRPDLALDALPRVRAPVLLIVGARDETVLQLNRAAYAELTCARHLAIVPGATHLFEEPGALEQVAETAGDWFARYLRAEAA
jgi:alpha-beta hydrolase superfamily lysophospholipase